MDFGNFLNINKADLDSRLDFILSQKLAEIGKINPGLKPLFKEFIKAVKGGKRLRGNLVLLGYKLAGGKNPKSVLDAACAFEIFQTAILAQDDIIDQSGKRRGKLSLYTALGGNHHGISQAISLSDLGMFLSFKLLSELEIDPKIKIRAINLFSSMAFDLSVGEMLDVEMPYFKGDFTEKDVLKIARFKTAKYTILGPLMIGAMLASAKNDYLEKLKNFGDNLGIAFQIQDDIFGIFGKEEITGKSSDSDIKECKATLLIAYAQENGTEKQRRILEKFYGNPEVNQVQVQDLKKVFKESGALDYAESRTEKYFNKALKFLDKNDEELRSLVDFLKNRKK